MAERYAGNYRAFTSATQAQSVAKHMSQGGKKYRVFYVVMRDTPGGGGRKPRLYTPKPGSPLWGL